MEVGPPPYQLFGRNHQAEVDARPYLSGLPDGTAPSSLGASVPERALKTTIICWSMMIWLISGVYFFATAAEAHFISLNGLSFLVVGVFAAVFYGMLFYFARSGFSRLLLKALSLPSPGVFGTSVQLLGFGLLVGETVLVYLAARECLGHLLAGDFPSLIIHARTFPGID
jgi:hypothetical protein